MEDISELLGVTVTVGIKLTMCNKE